jgi:hypothetical protein
MTEVDVKDLDVLHHFGGGVYIKQSLIPAGHTLVQHKHKFEHMTILAIGQAIVDGIVRNGPQVFVIPAEQYHGARTVTDCVWFCVHATDECDAEKVDDVLILPTSDEAEMLDLAKTL